MPELSVWFYGEGVVIGWRVRTDKCVWLWNIWKHLSTSTFPFLPPLLLSPSTEEWWVKGWDELLKFPLSEDKGTVPGKAQRKHLSQLFSLPFLSPFLCSLITLSHEKKFGLIILSCSQHKSVYLLLVRSERVSPLYLKCTGPAPWHLRLLPPTVPPKGRGHFSAGWQCGELALLPPVLQSWCLVWGIETHIFPLFERSEVQLPTFGFYTQCVHLTTEVTSSLSPNKALR